MTIIKKAVNLTAFFIIMDWENPNTFRPFPD